MNGNLAYQEEPREELLNGKIVMMSSPSVNHNITHTSHTEIGQKALKIYCF